MENMLINRIDANKVSFLPNAFTRLHSELYTTLPSEFKNNFQDQDDIERCTIEWRAVTNNSTDAFEVCIIVEKIVIIFEDCREWSIINNRIIPLDVCIESNDKSNFEDTRDFYPKYIEFYIDVNKLLKCEVTFNG